MRYAIRRLLHQPGFSAHRHPDAGARHRREHGHLLARQRRAAHAAALRSSGAPRHARPLLSRPEQPRGRICRADLPRHPPADARFRRVCRRAELVRQPDGKRRAGAAARIDGHGGLLQGVRRAGARRPDVRARGRHGGPRPRGRAQPRALAAAIRERPVGRRPEDPVERRAVRRDWRHAGAVHRLLPPPDGALGAGRVQARTVHRLAPHERVPRRGRTA